MCSATLTIDADVPPRHTQGLSHRREYGVSDFHRTFRVGGGIDADHIKATYASGVLEVTLPKRYPADGVHIRVREA